ncbi:Wzz/FepE/Etk N-terminal domain-containing protein [Porticoccaceae bacterium]|nr:Wzz/FepE/Etk N-terminal domain-containing protein [Porticoccaceae bacterium]
MQEQVRSGNESGAAYDDEIDLRELFGVLWAGRIIIAGVTSIFAIVAVIYALTIPNEYKATAVIAPAQSGGSGLGAMASQLGGLASLAGINIGGGEGGEAQEAMEIMQSWGFIEKFIEKNDLAVEVFAADGWDAGSAELSIDNDLYDVSERQWVRNPPSGKKAAPSSWELYEEFSKRLAVSSDKKSGLVSVSVEFYSPLAAKRWVDLFVVTINEHMRDRKLGQVNNNIQYLEAQIEKTAIADMREVFYQIIEEQIKNKMLAEASPEYAFTTVSRAMLPEQKSKPKRALICILGILLGGMLSILVVLIRHYSRKS